MDKGASGGLTMEMQTEREFQKDIQRIKSVYRLHLAYELVICLILMVCALCVIPKYVSEAAFQNFSFASTIVSIVLAVVSIVYSLWSGQKSNNQYMGMAHIESKIDEQLKGFERIEESISNRLNPINVQIAQIKDDQIKTRQAVDKMNDLLGTNSTSEGNSVHQLYNAKGNPLYADISLYVFALAYDRKTSIPSKLLDKLTGKYWSGFIVAISRTQPEKLNYVNKGGTIMVTAYDTDFFCKASDIKGRILNKSEEMRQTLAEIDNAIAAPAESDDAIR